MPQLCRSKFSNLVFRAKIVVNRPVEICLSNHRMQGLAPAQLGSSYNRTTARQVGLRPSMKLIALIRLTSSITNRCRLSSSNNMPIRCFSKLPSLWPHISCNRGLSCSSSWTQITPTSTIIWYSRRKVSWWLPPRATIQPKQSRKMMTQSLEAVSRIKEIVA